MGKNNQQNANNYLEEAYNTPLGRIIAEYEESLKKPPVGTQETLNTSVAPMYELPKSSGITQMAATPIVPEVEVDEALQEMAVENAQPKEYDEQYARAQVGKALGSLDIKTPELKGISINPSLSKEENPLDKMLGNVAANRKYVYDTLDEDSVRKGEAQRALFDEYAKQKVGAGNLMSAEDLPSATTIGSGDLEEKVYSFGTETLPKNAVDEYLAAWNDDVLHEKRFKEDAEYRNDWMLRHTGKSERRYREELADELEARLNAMKKDLQSQEQPSKYRGLGYAQGAPATSYSPVSMSKIDKALEVVNTLRKNNFGAGFAEGFDLGNILTLDLKDLGVNVALIKALNKDTRGEQLNANEKALVEAWSITQDAEEAIEMLGGRSLGANVGYGGAQSLGFITQNVATGGLASAATKGISRAAAKVALKRAMNTAANKGIGSALKYGSLKVAESAVGAAARVPFSGFTYKNYTDKRLNQFQLEERFNEATGKMEKVIGKQETSALRDAVRSALESFFEFQSEDVGGLFDYSVKAFAKALPRTNLLRRIATEGVSGPVKGAIPRLIKDAGKVYSLGGEVLSEAYGDAMVNTLTGDTDGWKQMATADYWWELAGVSAMLSGGFAATNRAANRVTGVTKYRNILEDARKRALNNINNEALRKRLVEASSLDDLAERSKMLASLDWGNTLTREDMANAIDFIQAQTKLDVADYSEGEANRLARMVPFLEKLSIAARDGEISYSELQENVSRTYMNAFRVQENQEDLARIYDRARLAAEVGVSANDINNIISEAGLTIYNVGDDFETLSGIKGIVNRVLPAAYEAIDEKGNIRLFQFEEVLQPSPEVREAQLATTEQTESAEAQAEPTQNATEVAVEEAKIQARNEADKVKNEDDGKVYEATLTDGTPVHIVKGTNIVYDDTNGEVDYEKSEATVVVQMEDGSRRQVSIRDIDSIDEVISVEEVAEVAGQTMQAAIETAQQAEQTQVTEGNSATEAPADVAPNPMIGRSLSDEEANAVILRMEENATVAPELELTPENWDEQFGEDGIVATPIGDVKMGENQYLKMSRQGRDGKLGMVKPTLTTPDIIVEEKSSAGDGAVAERNSSFVFLKAFTNTEWSRMYKFASVTIRKDGREVVISNQEKETPRIKRLLKEGMLTYISDATLPSESTASTQGVQPTIPGGATLSDNKNTTSEPQKQDVEQKNVAAPEIPTLKNGQPDYNAMSPEMFVEQYSAALGADKTELVARNNIKADNKAIADIEKKIAAITDPNKLPELDAKLEAVKAHKARYVSVLGIMGLSEAVEDNSTRQNRLRKDFAGRMTELFPGGFPNVESLILYDVATGAKFRWEDKETNGAVVSRGLGAELGLSAADAERKRRIGLLASDAPTPEEYAEQLRERLDAQGIRYDETELRDKVIDVLSSVDTVGSARKALEQLAASLNQEEEALDYEDEQARRAYERERQGLANEDGSYKLSSEVDENGRQFVLSSSGNVEFGEISEESGLPPAPILLSEGMITNKATNDGYGLVHIEARHGDQIRKAGYKSVVDFIEDVARNYEVIKEGNVRDGNNTYLLQITDKHNNTLMVELSGDGTYWNINTAGIFKTSYGKNRREVYNRHTTAKQPAETDEASRNAEPSGTQADPSMITTSTLNSSDNKNTTSAPNNQEAAQKKVDDPGLIGDEELSVEDETPFAIADEAVPADSSAAAQLATEAAIMALEDAGVEVVEATPEMVEEALQRRDIRMQTVEQQMSVLQKAERFIRNGLTRGARGSVFRIPLPDVVERMIRNVMGRDFDSHNIIINSIVHALRNHGVNGTKLTSNSIALTEEDATLIPYIMFAPDRVEKAPTDASGRESVRFYKELSNGYVVVVEKEYKNSPDDMETITMWAEISPKATNARQAAAPDTHARNAILSTDAAKIRKDAENAIRNDVNLRFQQQSAIDAEYFDAINAGDMELAKKLVREYAESRGYHLFGDFRDAHAAPSSSVDRPDFTNAEFINQQSLDEGWDVNLFAMPQGENLAPNDFWSPMGPRWYMYGDKAGMETHAVINSAIRSIMSQLREYGEVRNMPTVKVYRAVPTSVVVESLENGDWVTPSLTYATNYGLARFGEGDFRIIEQDVPATDLWWDGNDAREWGYDNGNVEAYANTPNHVNVLDPITRDDVGNIIPLSVRFDSSIDDPRFSIGPAPVFVSNAKIAVMGIKQEKATLEQWLKMIEKAGEDKWLGLSDWLKDSEKKTLTKKEVLDYINENQIRVEEVKYSEFGPGLIDEATRKLESEMRRIGLEAMRDKYPDFDDYFEVFDGELVWSEENASEGEYEDYIIYNEIVDVDPSQQGINETRLSYTTQGLTNKREIALTVPAIEPWNTSDEVHFGDAGRGRAIAWVRFGETTDSDGKRVLVIDEIQSKRHQEGRERGYATDVTEEQVKKAREEADVAFRMLESFDEQMAQKYGTRFWSDQGTNEEYAHWELLRSEYDRYGRIYEELYDKRSKAIPAAPFEKNWAELAMKRMLRYAAENGYDKVAWTTGNQQNERYHLSHVVDAIDYDFSDGNDGAIRMQFKDGGNHHVGVDKSTGLITFYNEHKQLIGKPLSDLLGKPLAERIISTTIPLGEISGDGLNIGGEGMRGFYDQVLPSFINKYGKKWGVKVSDITLPFVEKAGRTMHSVNVTDSMRESVMQGQPMFYRRPNGVVYGWTNGKTVYLTPEGMNPNTPIHEYTHIWADAMMKNNPKGWESIVKLLKGTPVWNEVVADVNYANIKDNDNQVASETLSRLSGRNNAAKMEAMAQQLLDEGGNDSVKKNRARKLLDRMRKALQEFWSWVGKELFGIEKFESIDEVTDRVLYDLVSGTDLGAVPAEGIHMDQQLTADKSFIRAYDSAFDELSSEYDALDKTDEASLKAFRAKKLDLVERYMSSMSSNLAMPTAPVIVDASDPDSVKKAYELLPDEYRKFVTFDSFIDEVSSAVGFYVADSKMSVYNISKNDALNSSREWLGILAHENGHKAVETLGISDSDKEKLWEFCKRTTTSVRKKIEKDYESAAERGEEYLVYTIQSRARYPRLGDLLAECIMGKKTAQDVVKTFKDSLPLRDEIVEKILNYFRDGYRKARGEADYSAAAGRAKSKEEVQGFYNRFRGGYSQGLRRDNSVGRDLDDILFNIGEQPLAPAFEEVKPTEEEKKAAEVEKRLQSLNRLQRSVRALVKKLHEAKEDDGDIARLIAEALESEVSKEGLQKFLDTGRFISDITHSLSRESIQAALNSMSDQIANAVIKHRKELLEKTLGIQVQSTTSMGIAIAHGVDDRTRAMIEVFRRFHRLAKPAPAYENAGLTVGSKVLEVTKSREAFEAFLNGKQSEISEIDKMDLMRWHTIWSEVAELEDAYITISLDIDKQSQKSRELYRKLKTVQKGSNAEEALKKERKLALEARRNMKRERLEAKQQIAQHLGDLLIALGQRIDVGRHARKGQMEIDANYRRDYLNRAMDDVRVGNTVKAYDGGKPDEELKKQQNKQKWWGFRKEHYYSFVYMVQSVSVNAVEGRGFLYDTLIEGEDGVIACQNREIEMNNADETKIYEFAKESGFKNLDGFANFFDQPLMFNGQQYMLLHENLFEGNTDKRRYGRVAVEEVPMTVGYALYLVMMAEQPGIAPTITNGMRITADEINILRMALNQDAYKKAMGFKEFAVKMLHDLREDRYNHASLERFGTQLDNNENYFPVRRLRKNLRKEQVDLDQITSVVAEDAKASVTASALIKRVKSYTAIDVRQNPLRLMMDHIHEMNHFAATAPIVRNVSILLNSQAFKEQLNIQKNELGQDKMNNYDRFELAAALAVGSFKPKTNTLNDILAGMQSMVSAGKVSFRFYTAAKQVLSLPAFMAYSPSPKYQALLLKNLFTFGFLPKKEGEKRFANVVSWCMQNLPTYAERWREKHAGDERIQSLKATKLAKWMYRTHFTTRAMMKFLEQIGMWANAAVDIFVCGVGAHTIYEYEVSRLKAQGMSATDAEALAKRRAAIGFNESQQSSLNAFMSPAQRQKDLASLATAVFENSNRSYGRKASIAGDYLRTELFDEKLRKKRYNLEVKREVERMENKMRSELSKQNNAEPDFSKRLSDEQIEAQIQAKRKEIEKEAERNAAAKISEARKRAAAEWFVYKVGLNYLWKISPMLATSMFMLGDDDEDKKGLNNYSLSLLLKYLAASYFRNGVGGATFEGALDGYGFSNMLTENTEKIYLNITKFVEGFNKEDAEVDWQAFGLALNAVANLAVNFDVQTFYNFYKGIHGMIYDREINDEDILRFISAPKSLINATTIPMKEDESEHDYVRRMAYLNAISDDEADRVEGLYIDQRTARDRSKLSKLEMWAKNYRRMQEAKLLDVPYEKDLRGRITVPMLEGLDDEYSVTLTAARRTRSGSILPKVEDYTPLTGVQKKRSADLAKTIRRINRIERKLERTEVSSPTYKEMLTEMIELKESVVARWNK